MRLLLVVHQNDADPGVFSDAIAASDADAVEWRPDRGGPPPAGFDAAMVFGGAMNVRDRDRLPWMLTELELIRDALSSSVPLLGVCLGSQLLAQAAGGSVRRAPEPEIGWYEVTRTGGPDPVLDALPDRVDAFEWHSFEAVPPAGSRTLAESAVCPQAWRLGDRPAWGIQFHAEVSLANALAWADDYASDPDAVALGIDPEQMKRDLHVRHAGWADTGRALAAAFLAAAADLTRA